MAGAPVHHQNRLPKPTRLRTSVIVVPLLILGVVGAAGMMYLKMKQGDAVKPAKTEGLIGVPDWVKAPPAHAKDEERPIAKPPRDLVAEQLQAMVREMQADRAARMKELQEQAARDARQEALLEELRKQPKPQQTAAPAEKPKPLEWVVPKLTAGHPLFPLPEKQEPVGQLISKAVHEIPERPELVLYRSQPILAFTDHEIRPDIPGQIRLRVSQPITDKFGQGHVLIPQHSYIIGKQLEVPHYGETRLALGVEEIQLEGGGVIRLKGQVADQSGAVGLKTKVSGNWPGIIAASLISATLSVGTMIPAGDPENYHLSVPQQIARNASNSLNQAGNQLVQREMMVRKFKPIKPGTPVALEVHENISLADPPVVVR